MTTSPTSTTQTNSPVKNISYENNVDEFFFENREICRKCEKLTPYRRKYRWMPDIIGLVHLGL